MCRPLDKVVIKFFPRDQVTGALQAEETKYRSPESGKKLACYRNGKRAYVLE